MNELKPEFFFNLADQKAAGLFFMSEVVWEALDRIKDYVRQTMIPNVASIRRHGDLVGKNTIIWQGHYLTEDLELIHGDATKGKFLVKHQGQILEGATVIYAGASFFDDEIELGPGVVVEPGALIKGPTIVGPFTEVRQGAYVRGSCLIGRSCVVGHVSEFKNVVMLDEAKAGHFAYLGDSILGRRVNLGAGTKLANLKFASGPIRIRCLGQIFELTRKKFGAILGDDVETGCNSVTSPGAILGPGAKVFPNATVSSGFHPAGSIIR
ncbi:MAG: glucose-1-phosphate thymidylyltransferase [Deltaproteobacteria bacterium]|nr:glucose-1-phosphate thymidylyltransferase [Deltaproteobacteria bacterium]